MEAIEQWTCHTLSFLAARTLYATVKILIETLIEALIKEEPLSQLWIVEPGRVRIHERM